MQEEIKKLNILFIASSMNRGLTFNFSRLAIALKRNGHNIIVVTEPYEEEKGLFNELNKNEVKIYAISGVDYLSVRKSIKVAKTLGTIIDHNDLHVIHAQGIRHLFVAFLASNLFSHKRVGIVTTVHSFFAGSNLEKWALFIESIVLNLFADFTVAVAANVVKKLEKYGLHKNKIIVIPNGIDLELFDSLKLKRNYIEKLSMRTILHPNIIVGYFARFVPLKGHRYLIESISEVSKEFPNIKLILAGKGPLLGQLKKLSKDLNIEEKVFFTGWLNHSQIYQLLDVINIYVFPSLGELFPFGIIEASAACKPIIASNVGGISEAVFDGINGYLVPPRDSSAMTKAIIRLIVDPETRRQMGEEGRTFLEKNYGMNVITKKLSVTYELASRARMQSK